MLGWLRAAASSAVARLSFVRNRTVSLIADWLAGALWLIDANFLNLAQKAFGSNAVAYSCVRLLSQSVPEAPLRSYQEDQDGNRTLLARDHPLVQLIRKPNELQTEYEFWELTTQFLAIVGSAYWWKQRANNGAPIALWPLRPDRVGPIYSDSDRPGERVLAGWSYQDPGSGAFVPIARRDVLSFNLPNPAGESGGIVEGLGPLQVLAGEISADNEATSFVGSLLKNYATPSLVLKVKAAVRDEEEANLIKSNARTNFGGARRGDVALLDADAEAQMIGFNLQQLEFPDVRSIAEARIAAAVGVPAILVGLKVGLDKGTYSNFDTARAFFAETTLSNYWRRYSDQMTNDLAAEFGPDLVCQFDTSEVRALAGQRVERMAPLKEGYEKGAVTINEYRSALGLPRLAGGDVRVIPSSMVEVLAEVEEVAGAAVKGLRHLTGRHDQSSHGHGGAGGSTPKVFASDTEGQAWLKSNYAGWRREISTKEDAALTFYQSPGYALMNGQLRGHSVSAPESDLKRAREASKNLKAAIAKSPPLEEPLSVWRGFEASQFGTLKAGMTISDKGFVSTALTKNQAGTYQKQGKQVLASIDLPVGTKAAAGSVKELILPPGSSFRVVSVKEGAKVVDVHMELVP